MISLVKHIDFLFKKLDKFLREERYKIIVSILFGFMGFIANFYLFEIDYGNYKVLVYWGVIFPLLIVLALGRFYGFISLIFGLFLFQPLFANDIPGWACIVRSINYAIWFYLIGNAHALRKSTKKYSLHIMKSQLIYVIITLGFYCVAFFLLLKFKFPAVNPKEVTYHFHNMVAFVLENISIQCMLLVVSDVLLLIPALGRFLGLDIPKNSNNSDWKIISGAYGLTIVMIIITDFFISGRKSRLFHMSEYATNEFIIILLLIEIACLFLVGISAHFSRNQIEMNNKLQISEARYRSIFENLNDIYCETDQEGIIKTISPSVKTILGYEVKDLIGIDIGDIFADRVKNTELIDCLLKDKEIINYEVTLLDVHGKLHYVWVHGKMIEDSKDNIGFIGMLRDVTQVIESNKKQEESERNYKLLYDKMLNAFCVYEPVYNECGDLEDVIYVDVNPSYERVTGLSKEEVIGKKWSSIFNMKYLYINEISNILTKDITWQGESYHPALKRYHMAHCFKLSDNRMGTVFDDITERKKKEDEIIEFAANFEAIIESSPDNILLVNDKYDLVTCNQAFADSIKKLTGEDIKNIDKVREKLPKEIFDVWPVLFDRAMKDGRFTVNHIFGKSFYEISCNPVYKDGKAIGVAAFSKNITDRVTVEMELAKLNEELEQRVWDRTQALQSMTNQLEAFTYTVSHDLKSPMKAIATYTSMIKGYYSDQMGYEMEEFINEITSISENAIKMIDKLLQYSTAVEQSVFKENLDIFEMINTTYLELLKANIDRQIDIVIETELPYVFADRILLKRVIENIISNAIKFTKSREKAIIRVSHTAAGGEVIFAFSDNGVGFDRALASDLFGIFKRLHPTDEYEGNGIGLAIVRRIIELHGGKAWIEGDVEKGATVYFTLPIVVD